MDVTMVLCDWAQESDGKLNLMGAGWNQMAANGVVSVAVGVLVQVPWDATNVKHDLLLELVDEDGHRVQIGPNGSEIVQGGQFETGRPPGVPAGTAITFPVAWRWPVVPLPAGGYSFVLTIDDAESARVSFRAVEAL